MGAKQSNPVFDGRIGLIPALISHLETPAEEAESLGLGPTSSGLSIPTSGRSGSHVLNQSLDGPDGDEEGELSPEGHRLLVGSLPAHLSPRLLGGFHCPVCSKFMASDEIEKHLLMCFSKTRLTYNKDILSRDSGECAICLDEMELGETIARLPCLCIYHKDEWFEVNRSCPEHPSD
ncbi:hypothetical protein KUCAC02_011566 [Chaenocephalus aceratus]|uniref:Uncharacterized protein n=1 Tax=Chaenocephalus aceratus TaxID=36190 RepID=A0ACB9WXQ6_CHAAC|nr:hypothetical protein KUCAC02_011566 [Chaenocephalus aceratus]